MTEPITREEMKAAMDVQSKNTEQMLAVVKHLEKIVDTQTHISQLQEKLVEKLTNGLKHEISHEVITDLTLACEPFVENIKRSCELLKDRTPVISRISADIERVKWFVGVVGLVIIVSTVILRGIETRAFSNRQVISQEKLLQDLHKYIEGVQQK